MREIIYQGLSVDNNKLIEGELIKKDNTFFIKENTNIFEVDSNTIGQNVEVKDRYGHNIYENSNILVRACNIFKEPFENYYLTKVVFKNGIFGILDCFDKIKPLTDITIYSIEVIHPLLADKELLHKINEISKEKSKIEKISENFVDDLCEEKYIDIEIPILLILDKKKTINRIKQYHEKYLVNKIKSLKIKKDSKYYEQIIFNHKEDIMNEILEKINKDIKNCPINRIINVPLRIYLKEDTRFLCVKSISIIDKDLFVNMI